MTENIKDLVTQFNKIVKKVPASDIGDDPVLGDYCRAMVLADTEREPDQVSYAISDFFWLTVFVFACKKLGVKAIVDTSRSTVTGDTLGMGTSFWDTRATVKGSIRRNNLIVCFKRRISGISVDVRKVNKRRMNILHTSITTSKQYTRQELLSPVDITLLKSLLHSSS